MRFLNIHYLCAMICLMAAIAILTGCAVPDMTMENRVTAQVRELDRLATRYYRQGRLDDAILYAEEIVQRVESAVGPDDIHLAQPLNNLAVLYEKAGRLDKAETLYQRVLAILEAKLGSEHVRTALNRSRLGAFYSRMNRPNDASALYQQSLTDLEKRLNPNHPLLTEPLLGLANTMLAKGKPQKALEYLERAQSILEKAGPKEKLRLATTLQSRSGIQMQLGDHDRAQALLEQAIAVITETLGPDHAMARDAQRRLADIFLYQGQSSQAADCLLKSLESVKRPTDRAASMFTLDSRNAFVTSFQNDCNLYLQLVLHNGSISSDHAARAYSIWLACKDLNIKIQPAFQAAFLRKNCDNTMDAYRAFVDKALDLARAELAVPDPDETGGYKKRLNKLTQQRTELEDQLKTTCPEFSLQQAQDTTGADRGMSALGPNEILVEYVCLDSISLNFQGANPVDLPERYAVFIVTSDSVKLLDLGPAETLDAAPLENKKDRQTNDSQESIPFDLLVRPWQQTNIGKNKIFIAPHGPLHAIPFESLQWPENAAVQVIPSGSVLVDRNTVPRESGQDISFIDPDFNAARETRQKILQKSNITYPVQPDGRRGQGMWGFQIPLVPESTDVQLSEKTKTSNAQIYRGETVLEDLLRSQNRPPKTLLIKTRCLGESARAADENPLRDYGLAMAGANHTLADPDLAHSRNIFTAEEIILTNLTGTDVTLVSDCLSDNSGDSIRTLRLAFFRAGARTVRFLPLTSNSN